jgi:hypothetical protein
VGALGGHKLKLSEAEQGTGRELVCVPRLVQDFDEPKEADNCEQLSDKHEGQDAREANEAVAKRCAIDEPISRSWAYRGLEGPACYVISGKRLGLRGLPVIYPCGAETKIESRSSLSIE